MKPYTQKFKRAYIDEFFRQLWSHSRTDWAWLEIESMVGSVFYVEGDNFVYCTPACATYLGGEDVPDDDNVQIAICRTTENGDYTEEGTLDFVLTYNFDADLHTYHTLMTAFRAGLIGVRKETTNA